MEPFYDHKGLEWVQAARGRIEQGVDKAQAWGSKTKGWFKGLPVVRGSQKTFAHWLAQAKKTDAAPWLAKLEEVRSDLFQGAKELGGKLGGWSGDFTLFALKKGFEMVMYQNTEDWVLDRANHFYPEKKLSSLAQMAALSEPEREALVAEYYPYDLGLFKSFGKSLDLSFNLTLGAAAASQLPGTGVAAGALNLVKTLTKLAGRISTLSSIYGFHIPSSAHLFLACSRILQSCQDFESNPNHRPLDPVLLSELYRKEAVDPEGFGRMLKEALKKEAYMAVPGVGVISLGKIGLDDLMVDQMVLHLVRNYFWRLTLERELGAERLAGLLERWKRIYAALEEQGWFEAAPKAGVETPSWSERLTALASLGEGSELKAKEVEKKATALFGGTLEFSGPEFTQKLKELLAAP